MTTYIPEALRRAVNQRAAGRCEYCRLPRDFGFFAYEIDHIYAEKHGGETVESNLCLACGDCNSYTGSDICSLDADTASIVALFHPRQDIWYEHFRLDPNGMIMPLTATGRVTVRLLRMNAVEMVAERAALIPLGAYSN